MPSQPARFTGWAVDKSTLPICCLLILQPHLWAEVVLLKPRCCHTKPKPVPKSVPSSLFQHSEFCSLTSQIKHDRNPPWPCSTLCSGCSAGFGFLSDTPRELREPGASSAHLPQPAAPAEAAIRGNSSFSGLRSGGTGGITEPRPGPPRGVSGRRRGQRRPSPRAGPGRSPPPSPPWPGAPRSPSACASGRSCRTATSASRYRRARDAPGSAPARRRYRHRAWEIPRGCPAASPAGTAGSRALPSAFPPGPSPRVRARCLGAGRSGAGQRCQAVPGRGAREERGTPG